MPDRSVEQSIESKIMEAVRRSTQPSEPAQILEQVCESSATEDPKDAREAIRSLVRKGDLQVTLDWKLLPGE